MRGCRSDRERVSATSSAGDMVKAANGCPLCTACLPVPVGDLRPDSMIRQFLGLYTTADPHRSPTFGSTGLAKTATACFCYDHVHISVPQSAH